MSKAINAYVNNQLVTSEKYLKQVLEVKPGDISATKVLKDLHTVMFQDWLDEAQDAFNQERWQDAFQAYQKAKKLNILRKDLSEKISLVLLYLEAERRLDKYVVDVEALLDIDMRKNAITTLEEIKGFGLSSKVINQNTKKLKQILNQLDQVYIFDITSDGRSEVIIYKVASLGMFTKQSVELLPGKYIAVARCAGHKESRHQFKVLPNHDNGFYISCGERM